MYIARSKYEAIWGKKKGEWHPQLRELSDFLGEINALKDAATKAKSAKALADRHEKEAALAEAKEAAIAQEIAAKKDKKAARQHRAKVPSSNFRFILLHLTHSSMSQRARTSTSQTTTRVDTDGESDEEESMDVVADPVVCRTRWRFRLPSFSY